MIYTIGHTESYESGFQEFKDNPQDFRKLGITDDYEGGSVWETREGAEEYLLKNPSLKFSVYGVDCDWSNTYETGGDGWRSLVESSMLVKLEGTGSHGRKGSKKK